MTAIVLDRKDVLGAVSVSVAWAFTLPLLVVQIVIAQREVDVLQVPHAVNVGRWDLH